MTKKREEKEPAGNRPPGAESGTEGAEREPGGAARLTRRVRAPGPVVRAVAAVDGVVEAAADAVEAVAAAATRLVPGGEPVARAASGVGESVEAALGSAGRRWGERPGARRRRLRRAARHPLSFLYDVHPEARQAIPKELGVRPIDVEEIVGTAVGGARRGGDFLPLGPFRTTNWAARWQRLESAVRKLTILPPIDVVKYGQGYWVLDGHNRIAAALYAGQIEIDANVTELIPLGGVSTERPGSLASTLASGRAVRAAGSGLPAGPIVEDGSLAEPRRESGEAL